MQKEKGKFKTVALKQSEYDKLVALAKRKGFRALATYIYVLSEKEKKRNNLTNEDLEKIRKYGMEYADYW